MLKFWNVIMCDYVYLTKKLTLIFDTTEENKKDQMFRIAFLKWHNSNATSKGIWSRLGIVP